MNNDPVFSRWLIACRVTPARRMNSAGSSNEPSFASFARAAIASVNISASSEDMAASRPAL
ncbi:hypothetical protein [Paraburkholderia youngii]|uniref:hypothetical protein n=1 Tax=Paraburkholderia youngii TaxID=2782701 RepID=UPI003D19FB27